LQEAALKSVSANLEGSYENRIGEFKLRCAAENQRIYAFAADQFRQFCDVSRHFDEREFRMLIARVKDELGRLTDAEVTVRKIIGGDPAQSIEDLVQQLVFTK
jgi:hypothetical protein